MSLMQLPKDILLFILTFMSLDIIIKAIVVSKYMKEICHLAIKAIPNIHIYIYDYGSIDMEISINVDRKTNISKITIPWNMFMTDADVHDFVADISGNWLQFTCFTCHACSISELSISYKLYNQIVYLNLSLWCSSDYHYITHLPMLQFINISFLEYEVWNVIIDNCKYIHHIRFDYIENNCRPLQYIAHSNTLWMLEICCDDIVSEFDVNLANKLLKSCTNLYYFSIAVTNNTNRIWLTSDTTNDTITLPSTLIGLKIGPQALHEIKLDFSACVSLRYVDIKLAIDTTETEYYINSENQHYRTITRLLTSLFDVYNKKMRNSNIFLSFDLYFKSVEITDFEKKIGILHFSRFIHENMTFNECILSNLSIMCKQINNIVSDDKSDVIEFMVRETFNMQINPLPIIKADIDTLEKLLLVVTYVNMLNTCEQTKQFQKYIQTIINREIKL